MGTPSSKQAAAIVAIVAVLCVLIAVSVLKQQQQKRPPPQSVPTTPSGLLPNPAGWSPTPASTTASSYYSGWLPAKATWYGAPTGAGPMDNGNALQHFGIFLSVFVQLISAMWLTNPTQSCRRCMRVQAHQPLPLLVHDILW